MTNKFALKPIDSKKFSITNRSFVSITNLERNQQGYKMFQFNGFNITFPDAGRSFSTSYKAFSVSMLPGNERQDVEKGGKIIMPPSALDTLTRLNVEYPMLFKLTNQKKVRSSHAGVLEFVADEGKCYLPNWMMDNLLLDEGDMLHIESVSLPVATFSKFQPHSTDFLDITNPKAVLENALRNFACLTSGDVIAIKYNRKVYELCVLETRPGPAVAIIECDMNVDFEAPVGYKEPTAVPMEESTEPEVPNIHEEIVEPFEGVGMRLDGKKKKRDQLENSVVRKKLPRGIPDYDYEFGTLTFDRTVRAISEKKDPADKEEDEEEEDKWGGSGMSMKKNVK